MGSVKFSSIKAKRAQKRKRPQEDAGGERAGQQGAPLHGSKGPSGSSAALALTFAGVDDADLEMEAGAPGSVPGAGVGGGARAGGATEAAGVVGAGVVPTAFKKNRRKKKKRGSIRVPTSQLRGQD